MFKQIKEGKAKAYVPEEKKVSKDLPVFYNPVMEYNRSISVALLNVLGRNDMHIALILEATGIRGLRFLLECKRSMIKELYINDYDPDAVKLIKKNLKLNNLAKRTIVTNLDANVLLAQSKGFDYIDIDPFGTPNPFLNNAVMHLKRDGILAVTATDTSALCGTFKEPCIRKYWAVPLHGEEMHEVGLRILIRKVQLLGMQFEKAMIPVLSYSKDHYMRIFFIAKKSKKLCDEVASQHRMYKNAGPIWTGKLKDQKIVERLSLDDAFTKAIKEELDILGYYEMPELNRKEKISSGKKIPDIINEIKCRGFSASRTHFCDQAIKTDMPYEELIKIIKR